MSDAKKYMGRCHCGQVRYEVEMALDKVISCNCSMCQRKGSLLAFVPATQFRLLSGEDAQTDYQFNKNVIHHLFCKVCGITSFAKGVHAGTEMRAINVRCLDDVDIAKLPVMQVDGRNV